MPSLNSIGQRLVAGLTHAKYVDDETRRRVARAEKVNVVGAGGVLTAAYEQLRNAAENTEEHLLLQNAIRRFYKRLFIMRDEALVRRSGGELVVELTLAGYIPKDSLLGGGLGGPGVGVRVDVAVFGCATAGGAQVVGDGLGAGGPVLEWCAGVAAGGDHDRVSGEVDPCSVGEPAVHLAGILDEAVGDHDLLDHGVLAVGLGIVSRGGSSGLGQEVLLVGGSFGADGFFFVGCCGLVAASAGSWCWGDPGVDDVVAGEGVVDGQEEVEGVGAGLGDGDVGAGAGEPLGLGVGVDSSDEGGAAAVDRGVGEGDHQQYAGDPRRAGPRRRRGRRDSGRPGQ